MLIKLYAKNVPPTSIKQNVQGKKFSSSSVWHGAVHILLFTVKAYVPVYAVLL